MIKFFLLLGLLFSPLLGQEKDEIRKYFRVLCLGDLPPWKEKIKNGVRVRVEPPAGSLPPSMLSLRAEEAFPNRMNTISSSLSYLVDVEELQLRDQSKGRGNNWKNMVPPKSSHSLVLLWRGKKDWRKPLSKSLPDTLAAFPAGKIRVINTSELPIRVRIGEKGKILKIGPGKGLLREIEPGETFLQVEALNSKGKRFRIFRNVFQAKPGERVNAFVYKADGVKPRRPLKLFLAAERARNYEPSKKRQK